MDLDCECRDAARWLAGNLKDAAVIVRPPWVVAGDGSQEDLKVCLGHVIEPAAHAMSVSYFVTWPRQPVCVVLYGKEEGYRRAAHVLLGDRDPPRFGVYRRHLRLVLANYGADPGAVTHELTHALMDFDFPSAPAWLAEGLASLHESYQLDERSGELIGLANWRHNLLHRAADQGRLPPLSTLESCRFNGSDADLNYALAQGFCRFLQQQGRLTAIYAAARDNVVARWSDNDDEFRSWIQRSKPNAYVPR